MVHQLAVQLATVLELLLHIVMKTERKLCFPGSFVRNSIVFYFGVYWLHILSFDEVILDLVYNSKTSNFLHFVMVLHFEMLRFVIVCEFVPTVPIFVLFACIFAWCCRIIKGSSAEHLVNDKPLSHKEYNKELEKINIFIKVKNFLVFQVLYIILSELKVWFYY